jgi:hypothetical protein
MAEQMASVSGFRWPMTRISLMLSAEASQNW